MTEKMPCAFGSVLLMSKDKQKYAEVYLLQQQWAHRLALACLRYALSLDRYFGEEMLVHFN